MCIRDRLRVRLVQLVELRLDGLHLGRGRVGLVGERKHDKLYEYGHQEDDDTKVGDEPVEEVEQRDDHESGEPAHEPTTPWNDLLVLLALSLIHISYLTFDGDCPPTSFNVPPSLNPSPRGRDLRSLQAVKKSGVSQMRNLSSLKYKLFAPVSYTHLPLK